jgi:hypothetical protein
MGSDVSSEYSAFQGLIVSHPLLEVWDDETSVTQAGPSPGVPVPQQDGHMSLQASGTSSAGGYIEVQAHDGGFPVVDGGKFVWRKATSGDYRGWDPPNLITGHEPILVTTSTTIQRYPNALTLRNQTTAANNGIVLMAHTGQGTVEINSRAVDDTWSTPASTIASPGGTAYHYPCMLELPTGRILLFHLVYDTTANEAQVTVLSRPTAGGSWSTFSANALDTVIDTSTYNIQRMRAAYKDGQILLVVWADATVDELLQYASSDHGATLEKVEFWTGTSATGAPCHDIVATDTHFVVAFFQGSNSFKAADVRLGSAFESLSNQTVNVIDAATKGPTTSGGLATEADLSLALDEDGSIYCLTLITGGSASPHLIGSHRSNNGGVTWTALGISIGAAAYSTVWNANVGTSQPRHFDVVAQRGRLVMVHNHETLSGSIPWTLSATYLGGYSTVTMPKVDAFRKITRQCGWSRTWLPFDLPSTLTWTLSGTGSESITAGALNMSTTSGQDKTNSISGAIHVPSTIAQGIHVRASLTPVSGTANIYVRLADATNEYEVRVTVTTTTVEILDANGGSLGSTALSGGRIDVLIGMRNNDVACWARLASGVGDPDRVWTEVGTSGALTDNATATTNQITFGHNTGAGAQESNWFEVMYAVGVDTGQGGLEASQSNPADLHPRPLSAVGSYVDDGTSIKGVGGPAYKGDEWFLTTRYAYPIGNTLTPSPRQTWRSTSTAVQQLAYRVSSQGDSSIGNDLLGVVWRHGNFSDAVIKGYDLGTTSWVTLATVDCTSGLGPLVYTRIGNSIKPTATTVIEPYLNLAEYAGATWAFADNNAKTRRILTNTEGKWTDSTTKLPTLILSAVDDTEAASGTTGKIVPQDVALLIPLDGVHFSGFMIEISTPAAAVVDPAESYFEIGSVVIGPAIVFGYPTSWGRTIDFERSVDVREARDGTVTTRTLAPARRTVETGWLDGIDQTAVLDADGYGDPDFVYVSTNGEPIAAEVDTPQQVARLVTEWLEGPGKLVTYLPRIAKSNNPQTFNRADEMLTGRIVSNVSIETVQGDELADEVVRVPPIRIREEV